MSKEDIAELEKEHLQDAPDAEVNEKIKLLVEEQNDSEFQEPLDQSIKRMFQAINRTPEPEQEEQDDHSVDSATQSPQEEVA